MINKKNVGLFLMLTVVNYVYVMDQYPLLERDISTLSDSEKKEYSKQREAYMMSLEYVRHCGYNQTQLPSDKTQANSARVVITEELLKKHPGISSLGLNEIYLIEALERQGERKITWEDVAKGFISYK